ncbi:hypothetical protein [Streptomyces sp. NPDC004830]
MPFVALNRAAAVAVAVAVAVAEADGPGAALALVDALDLDGAPPSDQPTPQLVYT